MKIRFISILLGLMFILPVLSAFDLLNINAQDFGNSTTDSGSSHAKVIPPVDPSGSSSTSPAGNSVPHSSAYILHAPIVINGNADFVVGTNGVVSGSGIKTNPFIISGWEFNTSVHDIQISVNNTDKYFVLRDCYIHNSNYSISPVGILLQGVRNGVVENNTICGNYYRAIYCIAIDSWCYNNSFRNNTIFNNVVGIWLHSLAGNGAVHDNHVTGNHIYNNTEQGIVYGTVYGNFIQNNSVESNGKYGLMLHSVFETKICHNRVIGNKGGFELDATCSYNRIFCNDIINNKGTGCEQAADAWHINNWSIAHFGNYWSDYTSRYPYAVKNGAVWNKSYDILGGGSAMDEYPLVDPITPAPIPPNLQFPGNDARTLGNDVNLTWLPEYNPVLTNFDVYFGTDNPPLSIIASNLSIAYIHVPTTDGSTYFWRVCAINPYGSGNSSLWSFTENTKPLPATEPVYPANGMTNVSYGSANVSWNASAADSDGDVVTFYWYVDNESSVTAPYVANGTASGNSSADFAALLNTTYYWKVRANDSYEWSNWSAVWNFTTMEYDSPPTVLVLSPSAGDVWRSGEVRNITWNCTDDKPLPPSPVDLFFSDDNGTTWASIASACKDNGSYAWSVSDLNSTQCRVNVTCTDSFSQSVCNLSAAFTITNWTAPVDDPPSVLLLSPDGGEIWKNGTIQTIRWNATDDKPLPPDAIRLLYSTDNGSGYTEIGSGLPNNGSYAWNVVDTPSGECIVKVVCTDSGLNSAEDTSNETFTIEHWAGPDIFPNVNVITPNGGEVWNQSTIQFIRWNATDDKPLSATCINISYSANNGSSWTIIGYELGNNGTMAWLVPDTVNSTQCLVKVECTDSAIQTTIDTSNGTFTIREVVTITDNPPDIYLLAPKTFDTLYGGEGCMIRWNATDDRALPSECVNISYSLDSGANWTGLAASHTNNGSYLWTVPRNDTTEAKVRVTVFDTKGQTATDTSGKFTIEKWNKSVDSKPNITSTPSSTATVGKEWTYQVVANDTDVQWGDYLLFSLDKSPQGMEINETSGLITWTPQEEGNYTVTVVATDSQGLSANQTFSVKVTAGAEEEMDFTWLMMGALVFIVIILCVLVILRTRFRKKKTAKATKDGADEEDAEKQKVYDHVASNPDDDFESICAALRLKERELNDKLQFFIGAGKIAERKDGRQRRFSVVIKDKTPTSSTKTPKPPTTPPKQEPVVPKPKIITPEPAPEKTPEPPTPKEVPKEPVVKEEPKAEPPKPVEATAEPKSVAPEPPKPTPAPAPVAVPVPLVAVPVPPAAQEKDESDDKPEADGFSLGDKILMSAYRNERYRNEMEVPYEMTQIGMYEKWNIKQNIMSKVLDRKEKQGYIKPVKKHIIGGKNRMDAYFLTGDGERLAMKLMQRQQEMDKKKGEKDKEKKQ